MVSFVDIIPIVIEMVLLSVIGFAWVFVCAIVYSGIKGGGHNIAAGATIPKGKEEEFLEILEKIIKSQLSKSSDVL